MDRTIEGKLMMYQQGVVIIFLLSAILFKLQSLTIGQCITAGALIAVTVMLAEYSYFRLMK